MNANMFRNMMFFKGTVSPKIGQKYIFFPFLESRGLITSFEQKKLRGSLCKVVPQRGGKGGVPHLKKKDKIIWGGKYQWILMKLSQNIPREYPLPPYAYFGPTAQTKGIVYSH